MTQYIALLRAVNVGGTGKLPMAELKAMAESCGFDAVRTYIASGNLLFRSNRPEAEVKSALEAKLHSYAGKPVGVAIRTAREMAAVLAKNPFPDASGNRVVAIFLDTDTTPATLQNLSGQAPDEEVALGIREIYVRYGNGMADTKLRIPVARNGTARNMNTIAKLAGMAAGSVPRAARTLNPAKRQCRSNPVSEQKTLPLAPDRFRLNRSAIQPEP